MKIVLQHKSVVVDILDHPTNESMVVLKLTDGKMVVEEKGRFEKNDQVTLKSFIEGEKPSFPLNNFLAVEKA